MEEVSLFVSVCLQGGPKNFKHKGTWFSAFGGTSQVLRIQSLQLIPVKVVSILSK